MKAKILHVAFDSMNLGGVQKDILDITDSIPECHFDVLVFVKEVGMLEEAFKKFGGQVFRITEYEGNNRFRRLAEPFIKKIRIFWQTYRILKKHGPYNAIHSHNQFRGAFTNSAAFFAGVKVRISHSHNDRPQVKHNIFKKTLLNIYRIINLTFSNVRMACSKKAAQYLFFKASKAEVIFNGINMKKFNMDLFSYIPNGNANFIHVGRYDVQKNQLFLLEVFFYILKELPKSRLRLIGYGKDETKIKRKIDELKISGNVEMYPPDSDVPKYMSQSEFMILPSLFEGFANVLVEAQTMGVECFASDVTPRESNLGIISYINLDIGPKEWADIIIDRIKNHDYSVKPRISQSEKDKVDIAILSRRYLEIYKG